MWKQYLAAGNLYGDLNFLDEKDLSISNCGCVLTQASLLPLSPFDNDGTCNTNTWQQYANQEYFTNGKKNYTEEWIIISTDYWDNQAGLKHSNWKLWKNNG